MGEERGVKERGRKKERERGRWIGKRREKEKKEEEMDIISNAFMDELEFNRNECLITLVFDDT